MILPLLEDDGLPHPSPAGTSWPSRHD